MTLELSAVVSAVLLACVSGAFVDQGSVNLGLPGIASPQGSTDRSAPWIVSTEGWARRGPSGTDSSEGSARLGPPGIASREKDATSLTSSAETSRQKLRQASLHAKNALEDPDNWSRLEDMARSIRYTAPLPLQVPLLMLAIHRVLGSSLAKFGVGDRNLGLVFQDLRDMSREDPHAKSLVQRIAGLVQNENAAGMSLYGAAALSITREQAADILDELVATMTTPENSKKLREAVTEAAEKPDPAFHILHLVEDMVGDQFSKFDIKKNDFLPAFSHLRSWAAMDMLLGPKLAKVMIALGGDPVP
eukprot:TRINITY_DN41008_c0_g1_i1.p1 TRINITY_DN41008_c0_g1~~TRINITY_DN41008_c0_g1_i1.p1  ORF type:complete len:304 (+),score=52.62 TRINITY_DN41008_c0_g1_i1:96-1007(+)